MLDHPTESYTLGWGNCPQKMLCKQCSCTIIQAEHYFYCSYGCLDKARDLFREKHANLIKIIKTSENFRALLLKRGDHVLSSAIESTKEWKELQTLSKDEDCFGDFRTFQGPILSAWWVLGK